MATLTTTPGYTFTSGETVETNDLNLLGSPTVAISNIVNADIGSGAAIALSKLATGALPAAITVASANIVNGTIVNDDVSATAAIAGTKINPNFGSQEAFAKRATVTNTDATAENSTFDLYRRGDGAVVYFVKTAPPTADVIAGSISITGSTTAYNTSSDYRLKDSVESLTGGLAAVEAMQPRSYKWKDGGKDAVGFIAHELQAVVPDAVTGEKDAVDADGKMIPQGVDASKLIPHLVAAIQELSARVRQLEK